MTSSYSGVMLITLVNRVRALPSWRVQLRVGMTRSVTGRVLRNVIPMVIAMVTCATLMVVMVVKGPIGPIVTHSLPIAVLRARLVPTSGVTVSQSADLIAVKTPMFVATASVRNLLSSYLTGLLGVRVRSTTRVT